MLLIENIHLRDQRIWQPEEEHYLLSYMERITRRQVVVDENHIRAIRLYIPRVAWRISHRWGHVAPSQVVVKIQLLLDRYQQFLWFIDRPFTHYDEIMNTVRVDPPYFQSRETDQDMQFREGGEPLYDLMRRLYEVREFERLDFMWLFQSYFYGHGRWWRSPVRGPRLIRL